MMSFFLILSALLTSIGGALVGWLFPTPKRLSTNQKAGVLLISIVCFAIAILVLRTQSNKAIERFDITTYPYEVGDAVTTLNSSVGRVYDVNYDLTDGAAGFVIVFVDPVDLTGFREIQFVYERKQSDTKVDFTIRDKDFACDPSVTSCPDIHTLPLGFQVPDYYNYSYTNPERNKFIYEIPLERFADLNLEEITQIGFNAQSHLSPGSRGFIISNITFVRQ